MSYLYRVWHSTKYMNMQYNTVWWLRMWQIVYRIRLEWLLPEYGPYVQKLVDDFKLLYNFELFLSQENLESIAALSRIAKFNNGLGQRCAPQWNWWAAGMFEHMRQNFGWQYWRLSNCRRQNKSTVVFRLVQKCCKYLPQVQNVLWLVFCLRLYALL